MQVLATALDTPLDIAAEGNFGAAFGAARLGMMAATGRTDISTPPPIQRTIEPVRALCGEFSDAHTRYRKAAEQIKDL